MLNKYDCLKKLADARGEGDVVVTTMSVSMPWAELSDTPLDFAHVDSAMGHAADFAYGLAILVAIGMVRPWWLNPEILTA